MVVRMDRGWPFEAVTLQCSKLWRVKSINCRKSERRRNFGDRLFLAKQEEPKQCTTVCPFHQDFGRLRTSGLNITHNDFKFPAIKKALAFPLGPSRGESKFCLSVSRIVFYLSWSHLLVCCYCSSRTLLELLGNCTSELCKSISSICA